MNGKLVARRALAALALGALALAVAACGPRTQIGDRYLGRDSITNGRSTLTNQQPASSP